MIDVLINKSVEPVRWLLILIIAAMLALTVLFFISPPTSELVNSTGGDAGDRPNTAPIDINMIANRHLFGIAGAAPTTEVDPNEQIAETRLPLELNGVFVAEEASYSAAIIAQKGKSGELYDIGDNVPGNAKLIEVHPSFVVLRRAGVRETLRFPELKSQFAAAAIDERGDFDEDEMDLIAELEELERQDPGFDADLPDDLPQTAREFVDRYRDRLQNDPDGALSELGVEPVSTGGAEGYKLGDLADSPYLNQTGLQAGDVVLSVNGRPVGNVQQDQLQMQSILAQGSARLEIQRGSRRFFVTASLR